MVNGVGDAEGDVIHGLQYLSLYFSGMKSMMVSQMNITNIAKEIQQLQ